MAVKKIVLKKTSRAILNRATRSRNLVNKFIGEFNIDPKVAKLFTDRLFTTDIASKSIGLKKEFLRTKRIIELFEQGDFNKIQRFKGFKDFAKPEFKEIINEFDRDFKKLVRETLNKLLKNKSEFYRENEELIEDYNRAKDDSFKSSEGKKIKKELSAKWKNYTKRQEDIKFGF